MLPGWTSLLGHAAYARMIKAGLLPPSEASESPLAAIGNDSLPLVSKQLG